MRPTGESLGEPYDVDELWPDEAELGSMLRSYYRKHPSPEVMAQHLFELRQIAEEELPAKSGGRWVRTALVAGAAACLLLAAFIAIGPARSRTEANLDTDPADTSMAEREQDVIVPTPSSAAQGLSGDEQGPVVTGRIVSDAPATTTGSPAPSTRATVVTTGAPASAPATTSPVASTTSEAGELSAAAPAAPVTSPQSTSVAVSSTTKPLAPTAGQQANSGQPSTTVATSEPSTTLQASTQPVLTQPLTTPTTQRPTTTRLTTTTRPTTAVPTTTAPPTTPAPTTTAPPKTSPPTTSPPTTSPPTTSPPTTSPPTTRPPLICTFPIIGDILCFF